MATAKKPAAKKAAPAKKVMAAKKAAPAKKVMAATKAAPAKKAAAPAKKVVAAKKAAPRVWLAGPLRVAVRAERGRPACRADARSRAHPHIHRRVGGPVQRPQKTRLELCGPHHGVRLHAGHGPGQRPPGGLPLAACGAEGAGRAGAAGLSMGGCSIRAVCRCFNDPFGLSLLKPVHRLCQPFDKLRVNGAGGVQASGTSMPPPHTHPPHPPTRSGLACRSQGTRCACPSTNPG